ncbi:MAG: cytochrome c oxidase assembly protein [Chloroflexi bacterium]|nr:cytochrome c oxidase assembly protein [Chloroflexota bacterium]
MEYLVHGWHWHIEGIIPLILFYQGYLVGIGPLRRHFGWAETVESRQVVAFSAGVLLIFLALFSPIHELADSLFSAHMVQHMMLVVLMPPLLLLGTPSWLLRPCLRLLSAKRLLRWLAHPMRAFILFNLVLIMWHFPIFYNATLRNVFVHEIQHVSLMITSVLVWWPILSPMPEIRRLSYPAQMVYLFLLAIVQTPLFAILTFSDHLIYSVYSGTQVGNISAVADQQMGGVIMKLVSAVAFMLAITITFFKWFGGEERREAQQTGLSNLSQARDS